MQDSDYEDDYGPYSKWVLNGRDDDLGDARKLLFEPEKRKKMTKETSMF